MLKSRKDLIFFIGITPMLLNSLLSLVGFKPVILIALASSLLYMSISNASRPKPVKRVQLVAIIMIIAVAGYIYSAVLIHGYSTYTAVIYAQAYFVLPFAMITLAYVINFKRANTFFLTFIVATLLQHVVFGFQGNYVSHHMHDGVSSFPGIIGHYHNSYIACFALILSAELMSLITRKVNIKNLVLAIFVIVLCGMPVFGAARGAILTNLIAILVFMLVKLKTIRFQSFFQIVLLIFVLVIVFSFIGGRINSLVGQQNTYGYSGVMDVLNISEYSSEGNYTVRVEWWQETLRETLSYSPIFGSIFENLDYAEFKVGYLNGSLMHSYFSGALQDGGAFLFLLILFLCLYPIIFTFRVRRVRENITKIIWLIAIMGALTTNTWMYGGTVGPILAYLYAYATMSIIKNKATRVV